MIDALLRAQCGLITTRQLIDAGWSQSRIVARSSQWRQPARGLHLTVEPTWETALRAGLLVGGEGAVIGQKAAAYEWGIIEDQPREIVVWSPRPHLNFTLGGWFIRFRRGARKPRRSIACTLVEDTVLDIAHDADEVGAVAVLTRALADRLTTGERILEALGERKRQRHRRVIAELCAEPGIESVLEHLFLRNVVDAHGLPRPTLQAKRNGGRVDEHYEDHGLIVELDGERYHRDNGRDHFRDNEHLLSHDELTLHFGWAQANGGACQSAGQLIRGLRKGGWQGVPKRAKCQCLLSSQSG